MIIRFILCFFTAIALNIRFEIPNNLSQIAGNSSILNIFYNFQLSLSGTMVSTTLVFSCLILLEIYFKKKHIVNNFYLYIICFILAIVWAMSESFRCVNSLILLYSDKGQLIKTIVYIIGITWLLVELASILSVFLECKWDLNVKCKFLKRVYYKHPFKTYLIGLLICWFPNLILSYPATMCPDSWGQLLQFFGKQTFTAHHPPISTISIGLAGRLGQLLGNGNWGLFFYAIIQTFLFALILSYMLHTMQILKAPNWLLGLSFFTAIACPYYTQYFGMILKDNIYSYFLVLFIIETIYILILKEIYWTNIKHILFLTISIIGSILFRNNGKYVIYPMIILLIIILIVQNRNKEKIRKQILFTSIGVFILSIGISFGIQQGMIQYFQIGDGSIREALSLPFQQTARYVKEHSEEVTLPEKKAINAILDYDNLATKYNPNIADPVKATYKEEATTQDLINYFKVWFQQGLNHPITYIEATMNQNYYLLYPLVENDSIYDTTENGDEITKQFAKELGIHELPTIQKLDRWRTGFNKMLFTLPIFGLLSNIAFYNLILIYLCYASINKRVTEMIIILMPLLISDVIIFLAPVIIGHPRYAFPIVYSIPLVFTTFLYLKQPRSSL